MCSANSVSNASLQTRFLEIMPRIETHARVYFRDIRCSMRKADCIAEAVALAWKWFCRLLKRGKDATQFVSALASLAAKAVRAGCRCCGQAHSNDVMNPVAQKRHNFTVESLPVSTRVADAALYDVVRGPRTREFFEERLTDNLMTPPPEQAAFRIDFPAWLKTLTPRERRIIRVMVTNERTKELSRRFEVTPGRISQMRREFKDGWHQFVGDLEEDVTA